MVAVTIYIGNTRIYKPLLFLCTPIYLTKQKSPQVPLDPAVQNREVCEHEITNERQYSGFSFNLNSPASWIKPNCLSRRSSDLATIMAQWWRLGLNCLDKYLNERIAYRIHTEQQKFNFLLPAMISYCSWILIRNGKCFRFDFACIK